MGLGSGFIWAPLFSLAMRNIQPRMAGAAAGVIETIQELGGVLAGAVVGAFLQNRLAVALLFRNGFVEAMHPTLILPIAVVLLAAVSCLAVKRRKHRARLEQQPEEAVA